MKRLNAYATAAAAIDNAAAALKPAIVDLGSTDDDFEFESMMRLYLDIKSHGRKISVRSAQLIDPEY